MNRVQLATPDPADFPELPVSQGRQVPRVPPETQELLDQLDYPGEMETQDLLDGGDELDPPGQQAHLEPLVRVGYLAPWGSLGYKGLRAFPGALVFLVCPDQVGILEQLGRPEAPVCRVHPDRPDQLERLVRWAAKEILGLQGLLVLLE